MEPIESVHEGHHTETTTARMESFQLYLVLGPDPGVPVLEGSCSNGRKVAYGPSRRAEMPTTGHMRPPEILPQRAYFGQTQCMGVETGYFFTQELQRGES